MRGFDTWDRAGYDMHGMPTEHAVEKKLGLKNKDEIIEFGVKKFTDECKKFCIDNLKVMNKDFERLGVWMDFENAYQTISDEWIDAEWWLVKKAHENKRLYEGEKSMCWCARCATALAKHELEYKSVTDKSIFVKFKVIGSENEFLIIWTTTPWTIPFNLGVMVNPDLDYVKAKVDGEIWIIAKGLVGAFLGSVADKPVDIIEEFKGTELEGIRYHHPMEAEIKEYEELKKKTDKLHSVVLSKEYVDLSAGTGLVHMAPGCGPEDYEIGHREGIPPFNNLDIHGTFPDSMGVFSGLKAKKDDKKIIEYLEDNRSLIAVTEVEHDYAHCWRCKEGIIYKTTKQWFFKIEDLKENMRELNKNIQWVPDYAGSRQFDSWLANLRDNGITRQRFWGTPVPIWRCTGCDNYTVIGSVEELKQKAGADPEDLHIPLIDNIKLSCGCGAEMHRVPDILDVWIDAGSASWGCIGYPQRQDLFDKMFPADFILEGIDQIRGWFNLLLVASMVSMEKPSFKAVYMHGFVQDAQGRKMSKSLGNYILPEEVISQFGADAFRFYMICGTDPGLDINYNFEDVKTKQRNIIVLWNLHNFLIDYSKNLGIKPDETMKDCELDLEETFILSRLNSTIKEVTGAFDDYRINEVPDMIESLFLDLSRKYIQFVREKSVTGTENEKKAVMNTIFKVLFESLKMFSTISPFISEKMFLNMKKEFDLEKESISLYTWPEFDDASIDKDIEQDFEIAGHMIQSILNAREKSKIGVRWPLSEVIVVSDKEQVKKSVDSLSRIITNHTNIKKIIVQDQLKGVKRETKANFKRLNSDFKEISHKIIAAMSKESTETILKHIEKDNAHKIKVNGDEVEIKKDHIIVTNIVPTPYEESDFRHGFVYLNKEMDDELEAEGFSRELMRRVQAGRKKASLSKTDSISLFIKTDEELKEMFEKYKDTIKDKVGASDISFSTEPPKDQYQNTNKEKIKEKELEIFFNKL